MVFALHRDEKLKRGKKWGKKKKNWPYFICVEKRGREKGRISTIHSSGTAENEES